MVVLPPVKWIQFESGKEVRWEWAWGWGQGGSGRGGGGRVGVGVGVGVGGGDMTSHDQLDLVGGGVSIEPGGIVHCTGPAWTMCPVCFVYIQIYRYMHRFYISAIIIPKT